MPRLAEGEFALVREHLDQAHRATNDPVRWGSAVTDLDFLNLYADAAARARDLEALEKYAAPAEQLAAAFGHRLYTAIALRARGVYALLCGQAGESVGFQDRALADFERLGTRYQLGLTLGERARAHSALGDAVSARGDWRRALELFEAQGALPAAEQARHALAGLQPDG